jgi:hypothetical protein
MAYLRNHEGRLARKAEDSAKKRANWFASLNRECMAKGCWITSSPGAGVVTLDALPGNGWPAELERRGFPMKAEPDGQRVLHYATTEKFAINADGSLDPLVEGSTKAVTSVVHHPGVVTVRRWSFLAPF